MTFTNKILNMNIELTFCQSTTHLPVTDNEVASHPIKLLSSFHVLSLKKKAGESLICQRKMLFCFSLSDQSINYSHLSAVEKWTELHEFANIASAITFFFDSKWSIINLDLFLYAAFCLKSMIHWIIHAVPLQNHILQSKQISSSDSTKNTIYCSLKIII